MIDTVKLLIFAAYLTFWTKLYRRDSFTEPLMETIGSIAHAMVIVSISLLVKMLLKR